MVRDPPSSVEQQLYPQPVPGAQTSQTPGLAGHLPSDHTAVPWCGSCPELPFPLQFVLKHREFAHLREVKALPNALNPHKEESLALVKAMIDQVMDLHEDLQWFHIGCDEVGLLLSWECFFSFEE